MQDTLMMLRRLRLHCTANTKAQLSCIGDSNKMGECISRLEVGEVVSGAVRQAHWRCIWLRIDGGCEYRYIVGVAAHCVGDTSNEFRLCHDRIELCLQLGAFEV